jgi:hypothetical protein
MWTFNATTATLSSNTAVGTNSLGFYSKVTGLGSTNVAIGLQAMELYSNTTGDVSDNVAVGVNALRMYGNTTQTTQFNTAVGRDALVVNQSSNNTAVGHQAGVANTTGTTNVYIGKNAGLGNSTGSNNVFVGTEAGSTSYGGNNTLIGNGAGYSVSSGFGNTFIGSGIGGARFPSGYFVSTGSKNTILGNYDGNQNGLDIRTLSNVVVLSDGDGVPVMFTVPGQTVALQGASSNGGTGINFPATQSASGNPNALDDYEEGTWTPTVTGGYTGITYNTQNGYYTKIGRLVNIVCYVQFSGTFDSSTITVSAIPFPLVASGNCGTVGYWDVTNDGNLSAWVSGPTSVVFYKIGTTSAATSTGSVTGKFIIFSITGYI